ncbi:hypothetical protein ACQCX2_09965 [Propionibacteriaceae bacterium Y1700]|uniref:hypothetical protein n=1 Tax=Microlunatus sp. Y1700 TaxID=3418487 RepID=UPI003DA74BCB
MTDPSNDKNSGTEEGGFAATDRTEATSDTSIHNTPDSDVTPEHKADKPAEENVTDPAEERTQESASEAHETQKAFLGRPEFTPLYAMAGLADLAAAVVRDLVNEQIAAYNARRNKDGAAADGVGESGESGSDEQAKTEFNAFLQTAQQRTQELYDQALQQYSHLADRGRVAVGDVVENAKAQRAKAGDKVDDGAQNSADDLSKAAERLADRVTAAAKAAADRVSRTAKADKGSATTDTEEPTVGSDVSEDLGDEPITSPDGAASEPATLEDDTTVGNATTGGEDTGTGTTTWPTDGTTK